MTRRRLVVLVSGLLVLGGLFVWKMVFPPSSPGLPPRPERDTFPAESVGNDQPDDGLIHLQGKTMGTTYSVKFLPPVSLMGPIVQLKVDAVLTEVNATMSTYDPKSELSLFNQSPAEEAFSASPALFSIVEQSARLSLLTGGAFDVTVGPLVRAYGFGPAAAEKLPSADELEKLRELIGMKHLHLDPELQTLTKTHAGVYVDLSAIAKGFGVDQIAKALDDFRIENYMVEVGGEIRTKGTKPKDAPWKLAIEKPTPQGRSILMTLPMPKAGGALATSGDYRNFRKNGDELVSHTMDPRQGRPVPRRTASVSVIRPTAAEADALATALGVMEPREAIALANREKYAVLLLVHKKAGRWTSLASEPFLADYSLPPL